MSLRGIVFSLCRFFAVYSFTQGFLYSVTFFLEVNFGRIVEPAMHALLLSIPIAQALIGILLWWRAEWLSRKISGPYAEGSFAMNLTAEEVEKVGFVILGMLFFIEALVLLTLHLEPIVSHKQYNIAFIAKDIAEGVLGLVLLLGAGVITRIFRRLRRL